MKVFHSLRRKRPNKEVSEWEYLPSGWEKGLKDLAVRGWDAASVADTLAERWPSFLDSISAPKPFNLSNEAVGPGGDDLNFHNNVMSFAYVLAAVSKGKSRISFLDWGGGVGHYYKIAKSLFPDMEIAYTCKDVALLCAAGRRLLPEGRFVSDEKECLDQKYDLVMASTSLQYSRDWQDVLAKLIRSANPHLFVTRLPVIEEKPSYVILQRPYKYGYDTEYIGWCINKKEFLDLAEAAGAVLRRTFICGEDANIIVRDAPEQARYQGFLFGKLR